MKFSKFQTRRRMENGFSELKLEAHSFRSYRTGLTGYFIESCRLSRWAEIGNRWRRDCHHLPWSILNYAPPSNHCSYSRVLLQRSTRGYFRINSDLNWTNLFRKSREMKRKFLLAFFLHLVSISRLHFWKLDLNC